MVRARGPDHMQRMSRRAALPSTLALVAITFAGATRAANDASTVSAQNVQAKLQYCNVCHGVSAQGFLGYYPIPRLAGQQIAYIENQLQGFAEQKRTNNIMFNVGHVLSSEMITALATNFHDLNPKPLGNGPKELVAAGKQIFEEGVPSASVTACASCHGKDAKGNGQFPRLAGQLYAYVTLQLTNWSKERAENNSAIMAPIARSLTESQIKAVAAYVSYLE
jgi:cbb3-type cytochrome c oxidase subunit III